jgi:hypothetical protein
MLHKIRLIVDREGRAEQSLDLPAVGSTGIYLEAGDELFVEVTEVRLLREKYELEFLRIRTLQLRPGNPVPVKGSRFRVSGSYSSSENGGWSFERATAAQADMPPTESPWAWRAQRAQRGKVADPALLPPPWRNLEILKHDAGEEPLSGLYCLATLAGWFHQFDNAPPTTPAIVDAMKAMISGALPMDGLLEEDLRRAADLFGLIIYSPDPESIADFPWPRSWMWIAVVRGLPAPGCQPPPLEPRCVVVLASREDKSTLLIADPHPDVPANYQVSVEAFTVAWQAGATTTHKPWAVVVWRPHP